MDHQQHSSFSLTMGWVDLIPRIGKLYIGGLHALYQKPDLFQQAGITHILSVLDFDIYEAGAFKQYKHLHIRLDDDPNENLLQHFKETNQFIQQGLDSGGGVFVHCAMGKSRSAAICCAYLMHKNGVSPHRALSQVCDGRPVCSPNPGQFPCCLNLTSIVLISTCGRLHGTA